MNIYKKIFKNFLLCTLLHNELVGNQRDKLAVGGLFELAVNIISENTVHIFHLAARPCDLTGVADGALDLACGGVTPGSDAGI